MAEQTMSTAPSNADGDQDKAEKEQETTTFRFLDFPAELQLRIIEFAVTEEEPIQITYQAWLLKTTGFDDPDDAEYRDKWKTETASRQQPAITRVSRSIRVDAIKMYYENNVFEAGYCSTTSETEGKATAKWLAAIGVKNRRRLRNLIIIESLLEIGEGIDKEEDPCLANFTRQMNGLGFHAVIGEQLQHHERPHYRVIFQAEEAL